MKKGKTESMRKMFMAMISLLAAVSMIQAQVNLDTAKAELYKINKVFDSSRYVGFDINFIYSSDTVYGKFAYEELAGKYILNEKNIYYRLGNTEYIQNDSFVYNIYHDEKMIMMTRDLVIAKSSLFPLREFVDSALNTYDSGYIISQSEDDELKMLGFKAKFDSIPFQWFAIYYEPESHLPDRFEMHYFDGVDESDTAFLLGDTIQKLAFTKHPVKRRITIKFSNYHSPNKLDVFVNENYVFFNRQTRRYSPADKFSGYRFITNGIEGNGPDETVEVYPPPAPTVPPF
jgi:hypothetical protein